MVVKGIEFAALKFLRKLIRHTRSVFKAPLLVLALLLPAFALQAQKPIRTNLRADICIPIISSNYVLRKSFAEVIDVNMSYQLTLGKNFTLGPALGFTHFTIDSFTYPKFSTRMFITTPAAEVGYQAYMGENSLFTGSLQVGYSFARYSNVFSDTLKTPSGYNFNALSLEPMMRFYFFTGDRLALGFKLSYKMIFGYTPYRNLYFDKTNSFNDKQDRGTTQYMNVGVIVLIGTSKKNVKE